MKVLKLSLLLVAVLLGTAASVWATDFWLEHFTGGTPGTQPAGWYDDRNDSNNHALINYNVTDSYVNVTVIAGQTWGKVLSFSQNVDVTAYPKLEVVVQAVNSGGLKVGVFIPAPWEEHVSATAITVPGTYLIDIPTLSGGWSGTKNMGIEFVVEGTGGSIVIDSVRILLPNTPTPTSTFTLTHTPTATLTVSPTPTISATQTNSPTVSPTPNQSLTPTNTPTHTSTATISVTATVTPTATITRTQTQTFTATQTATATSGVPEVIYDEPFSTAGSPPTGWTPDANINMVASGGYAYLTITSGTYGKAQNTTDLVGINTTYYPYLRIDIAGISASSSLSFQVDKGGAVTNLNQTTDGLGPYYTQPGTYIFNYAALASFSGAQSFKIVVWANGSAGTTCTIDRIQIMHTLPATPTATVTLTPIPVENVFLDHFTNGIAPVIPPDWRDETTNPGYQATIKRQADTLALVANTSAGYGKVLSKILTTDFNAYQELEVKVSDIAPNTKLFLGLQMETAPYTAYDLGAVITSPGVYTRNIPALNTAALSGTHTYSIKLRLDNAGGTNNVTLDYVRLGITSTPTASPTATLTPVTNNFRPAVNLFLPKDGPLKLYYGVERPNKYKITVFNLAGQTIRTLEEKDVTDTIYGSIEWDGKNDAGNWVASGVYIIRLETDVYRQNIRVAVVR